MNIFINNKEQELATASHLETALDTVNLLTAKGIAVAVNNMVVPRRDWGNYSLSENDRITIIKATQGG